MGIIGKLLGTGKAVEKGIELVGKISDSAVYTKQEKAGMVTKLYDSYLPRSLSRRYVALVITLLYSIAFLSGLISASCQENQLQAILDLVVAFKLGILMLSVVFFYFGYYGLEKMKK